MQNKLTIGDLIYVDNGSFGVVTAIDIPSGFYPDTETLCKIYWLNVQAAIQSGHYNADWVAGWKINVDNMNERL